MAPERMPPVDSPATAAFATVAEEFCSLIECHPSSGRDEFLRAIHLALPRLYLAGLQLPSTAILFNDEAGTDVPRVGAEPSEPARDPDRLTTDDAAALCRSLSTLIGRRDLYRSVFDPFELTHAPETIGTLADDLSDTFRDVEAGLKKWRRGESGEALWEWRFGFLHHWGRHVASALHALYVLNADYEYNWPGEQPSDSAVR